MSGQPLQAGDGPGLLFDGNQIVTPPTAWWLRRHRLQAKNKTPLDKRTSQRFAREFEAALKQRGAAAKQLAAQ